ncbi:MAG: diguanylate cyclase [Acidobacteriia bacterium]|nr:diguanylate cyclase [Terriglobia bacterium]
MPLTARLYIAVVIAAGAECLAAAIHTWSSPNPARYFVYLGLALLASRLKVRLPGITGVMSVLFVFVLLATMDCGYAETVALACLAGAVQTGRRGRRYLLQVGFNSASLAIAASGGWAVFHSGSQPGEALPLRIAAAVSVFFLLNSLSVSGVVSLTEHKRLFRTWKECYFWSFPYYLLGAGVAAAVSWCNRRFGWQAAVVALPIIYFIYRSYKLYLRMLQSEKQHSEQMAALHMRTIEALALAIEAKDESSHPHGNRIPVYAVELGRKLGLSELELQALRAASILHDIGKLAVPEHIISKPGKLTPEEFAKMKIHPVVGAEILSRVEFPYPVVPIVRAHHEKWDGSGYPDGLMGEATPIGARILSAVDCLDALASDRYHRGALSLDDAMAVVVGEAGKSYDPKVVEILRRNYREWEQLAANSALETVRPREHVLERNGTGSEPQPDRSEPEFLASIAAARQEARILYELARDLGSSLSLNETLSVLDNRLKALIPYDAIAVYRKKENCLTPAYVNGEGARLLAALEIPVGHGLSGCVAENGKPIVNGNAWIEAGDRSDSPGWIDLKSALAAPLENGAGITGVIALYRVDRDAFRQDHLRVLLAISPKISLAIENALKYEQAAISATTDGLTGLPNARSLFLHLDSELARARRANGTLAVLVCDLDGFKQVNDRFGHLEGNRVLELVAAGIQRNCREYDYVARMGGDEFILVLTDLPPQRLEETVKRLDQVATEVAIEVCREPLIGVSAGAAFFPADGKDAETLLAEADRRMYLAKQERKACSREFASTSLAALNVALQPEPPRAVAN